MRKIVQIAYGVSNAFDHIVDEMETAGGLFALCDDNTVWKLVYLDFKNRKGNEWIKLPDIPQCDIEEKPSYLQKQKDFWNNIEMQLWDISIDELNLKHQGYEVLCELKIENLYQLCFLNHKKMMNLRGVGIRTVTDIATVLAKFLNEKYEGFNFDDYNFFSSLKYSKCAREKLNSIGVNI